MVEFPVVFAFATAALLLCVQLLGYGVSYMYANHAAEEAAHSYGVGMSPDEVYQEVADHLPEAYSSDMTITRGAGDSVTVSLLFETGAEIIWILKSNFFADNFYWKSQIDQQVFRYFNPKIRYRNR